MLQKWPCALNFSCFDLEFPEPEPWSAGRALLSWDGLCGTVFGLLYRDGDDTAHFQATTQRLFCSTSDVSTNIKKHLPLPGAVVAFFRYSGTGHKLPTYLLYCLFLVCRYICGIYSPVHMLRARSQEQKSLSVCSVHCCYTFIWKTV